jgi:hypothetical protein
MSGQQKNNKPAKYSEKLKDPRWQKLRLKVFERDDWTCQLCFDKESQLKVHHKYYLQGKEPWDYPLEAFTTLCEKCHTEEYENRPEAEHVLLRALKEKFTPCASLAEGVSRMELLHSHDLVASSYAWALGIPEIQRRLLDRYLASTNQNAREPKNSRLHTDVAGHTP